MHEQIEALRRRIDEVGRAADGRRTFTAVIRKEAVTLAQQWHKSGRNLSALADALALHKTTLRAWIEGVPTKRVRAIEVESEVVESPVTKQNASTLVAVLPSGIRIEGLVLADVIELAGAAMMLRPGRLTIYAFCEPIDLRKGFEGLAGIVRNDMKKDPLSGWLFLFTNRSRSGRG